jgi:hypothetical protein
LPFGNWPAHVALSPQEAHEQEELDKRELASIERVLTVQAKIRTPCLIERLADKISSWPQLMRATVWWLRFLAYKIPSFVNLSTLVVKAEDKERRPISVAELRSAQVFWVRVIQFELRESVCALKPGELMPHSSGLAQFQLYMDEQNIVRSLTRLAASETLPETCKLPIILPKHHPLVERLILHLHAVNGHLSLSSTQYYVRRQFRLIGGKKELSRILHTCKKRHCNKPIPMAQKMAPLPVERLDGYTSFDRVSCDFFGPMYTKHTCSLRPKPKKRPTGTDLDKQKEFFCPHEEKDEKSWGCLFVCFYTRAVHLELVEDMTADSFLKALYRMCGRRGAPSYLWSDNAQTFKAADRELTRLHKQIDWKEVEQKARDKGIQWEWSISKASHSNGVCERLVRSVKEGLRTTLGNCRISRVHLQTILCEIEGLVNERPLSEVSEREDDAATVTPNLLCIGRNIVPLPIDTSKSTTIPTSFSKMHAHRKFLLNQFWKVWRKEYLLSLQVSRYWLKNKPPPLEINQVVLIRDENLSKGVWRLGRILELQTGRNDNLVRRVKLRTQSGTLERHINSLSLLEGSDIAAISDRVSKSPPPVT